jgi:chemotaxis protein methyltransferase CheR
MERWKAQEELEELEIDLLLEAISRRHGRDFRGYDRRYLKRGVMNAVLSEGLESISALQERVLHDPDCVGRVLPSLMVGDTALFRDPGFYRALRERVLPQLRSHPFIRIWHAGCSTGEEVYSTAILLHEEGLYERCRIYATDSDEAALKTAQQGAFPRSVMPDHSAAYEAAGGTRSFRAYCSAHDDHLRFDKSLRRNVVFAPHNLVTDASLNEFNLILCRNVLMYFNAALQRRVHQLLFESLRRFGILGLGHEETLENAPPHSYEPFDPEERLFRRRA